MKETVESIYMNGLKLISPAMWEDYELIDSGGFEKLERFGRWIISRPEPQAIWAKSISQTDWDTMAHACFRKDNSNDERGEWILTPVMPSQWMVGYNYKQMQIKMRMGLTSFKHVGIFPEQAENWNFIYDNVKNITAKGQSPRVLNLFAYTGGATVAASSGGAETTHVDSVKQVVSWANENCQASGVSNIRWIVDDAMKFVRREVKRGNMYDGIILDPPAYGRGPDGERWILEENILEMLTLCSRILKPTGSFLVLNLYSMGLSALLAKGIANQTFGQCSDEEFGELYIPDRAGKALPLGVFYRFSR